MVWALGQVNFLFDRSTEPNVTRDDLADAFGLSKSTLGQKAKQIRDILVSSRRTDTSHASGTSSPCATPDASRE